MVGVLPTVGSTDQVVIARATANIERPMPNRVRMWGLHWLCGRELSLSNNPHTGFDCPPLPCRAPQKGWFCAHPQTAMSALPPKSWHLQCNSACLLWVKSRHLQCKTRCPLCTWKRTFPDYSAVSSPSFGPFKATHHKSNLFNVAPSWEVDALKLVAEHIRDAILFEQMASRETSADRKETLQRQAKAHRKLADERAKELGLVEPPPLSWAINWTRRLVMWFSRFLRPALKNLRLRDCWSR